MKNNDLNFKDSDGHTVTSSQYVLPPYLICFSHLRWDFVFQRPQHLLTRFSQVFKVFYIEEPLMDAVTGIPFLSYTCILPNLTVVIPHLPCGITGEEADLLQKRLIDNFFSDKSLADCIFWYYTPMALSFTEHLQPVFTVYDCMDELSGFKNAPVQLLRREATLFNQADIVFTGGYSLYQAKKLKHKAVHLFPSSIEKEHFGKARTDSKEQDDFKGLSYPVLGFAGVIDERFDLELIAEVARLRPEWTFMLIGPIVKIDTETIPDLPNIILTGPKLYKDLPDYMRNWNIGLIPFKLDESTRFISPTKTPEYLAAGIPVISTPIYDVVYQYGSKGLVEICTDAREFINSAEILLNRSPQYIEDWKIKVDRELSTQSWDLTYSEMLDKIRRNLLQKQDKVSAGRFLSSAADQLTDSI